MIFGHRLQLTLRGRLVAEPQRNFREQQARVGQVGLVLQRIAQLDERAAMLALRDQLLGARHALLRAREVIATRGREQSHQYAAEENGTTHHG